MSNQCSVCGAELAAGQPICLRCRHRQRADAAPPPLPGRAVTGATPVSPAAPTAPTAFAGPAGSVASTPPAGAGIAPPVPPAPTSSGSSGSPPRANRWSLWWLALLAPALALFAWSQWWSIPAADTYTALAQEQLLRTGLVGEILPVVAALAELPTGDPKSIADVQTKLKGLHDQLEARGVELERDVTAAAEELTAANAELQAINQLASLHRVKERKATGSRYINDWYGGYYQTTYATVYKVCGSDQCGGTCGSCSESELCFGGYCRCIPKCDGKSCGSDGCGGSCGTCNSVTQCDDGVCRPRFDKVAPQQECEPVCADTGVSGKSSRGSKSLLGALQAAVTPSASEALAQVHGRVMGRSQALQPDQLDAWIAALEAEMAALDQVLTSLNNARSVAANLRTEQSDAEGQLKTARETLAVAKAALTAAQRAAKGAVPPDPAALTAATQAQTDAATAVARLAATIADKKRAVAEADKQVRSLEKRAKLAITQRPLVGQEHAAFVQVRDRKQAAVTRVAQAEQRVQSATAAKTAGVAQLRATLAPQLDPLESQLAGLTKPFVSKSALPLGHAMGGQPGNHPQAPEAPSHLSARTLQASAVLEQRLEDFRLACQTVWERRRAAWAQLSGEERAKFTDWPAQDDVLERLIGQLDGLERANQRLARVWRRLGG